MPSARGRLRALALALAVSAVAAACGSGAIDGKYYNSQSGEYALELKGGKVTWIQGIGDVDMTYEVKGDSLVITDADGGLVDGMTFGIESDGSLSLGPLGSLTKNRP
jgi:hypothetical protein